LKPKYTVDFVLKDIIFNIKSFQDSSMVITAMLNREARNNTLRLLVCYYLIKTYSSKKILINYQRKGVVSKQFYKCTNEI